MASYEECYRQSIEHREEFWRQAADAISWHRAPRTVLDDSRSPFTRWFVDGELNTCFNAVDRHVEEGRADQPALIYDSPVTDSLGTLTFAELRDEVARCAGALRSLGVGKGDRVVIYMPMVPEAVVAMLACARLGAVHAVVFGGFAARELAVRVDDAKPRVLVTASCGIEGARVVEYKPLVDRALEIAEHQPEHVMLMQRPQAQAAMQAGRDLDWHELMSNASPAECVPVAATDPLYILHTSGTTGKPKGVVRDNGGHAVALRWSMPNIFDTHPGEVFWAASDIGWVVGHSYIVYAPLLTGCTTVIYEGKPVGTPDPGAFWRVIAQHKVKTLFTAPTALRAIKKEDPDGAYLDREGLADFAALFLAGERLDPDTYHWVRAMLDRPVIDHMWQTETGWPMVANCLGIEPLPVKAGSATKPVPGWDVRVLDEQGTEVPPNREGAVVVKLPLAPGAMLTLWEDDERFVSSYMSRYPGFYLAGDSGYVDEDGYVFVMGRTDDVINVAGHRLSTGAMEEVLATHPDVAECAVIGVADERKGQLPHGFVVLKAGADPDPDTLREELIQLVRDEIGPVAAFKRVLTVDRLPKTRSGKILRRTMRAIADGKTYDTPSTIEDPAVLDEIEESLGVERSSGAS